jgi:DNA-binding NarL/FixJ family response regulator
MTLKTTAATASKAARILIVDDHPALCEGLGHRIAAQPDMSVCGQAADVDEALAKVRELQPDVVIVDIALKSSDGLELVTALKSHYKHIRSLVHSMYEESLYADRCLRAGAMGYVNKGANPEEVVKAIRDVLAGRVYLSPTMTSKFLGRAVSGNEPQLDPVATLTNRQLEVFRLIGEGKTTAQLAEQMHISVHTVETHRENIKRKLGATSAPELIRRAVQWVLEGRQSP